LPVWKGCQSRKEKAVFFRVAKAVVCLAVFLEDIS